MATSVSTFGWASRSLNSCKMRVLSRWAFSFSEISLPNSLMRSAELTEGLNSSTRVMESALTLSCCSL